MNIFEKIGMSLMFSFIVIMIGYMLFMVSPAIIYTHKKVVSQFKKALSYNADKMTWRCHGLGRCENDK